MSKNTIDTDSTAKDGDEDKFEQERIEIKRSGGIDCNNNKYNEDNKEVEVEVGMQMKANTKIELVMKLDKEEEEGDNLKDEAISMEKSV